MKKSTRIAMTALAAAAAMTAFTVPALAVTLSGSLDNSGYWSPLLYLGSNFATEQITAGDIGTDYLAGHGGEANQNPYDGLAYANIPNATANPLVWTAMDNPGGAGNYWTPNTDGYVKYWHIYVVVPGAADREICWKFRHDDEIRIWNNGALAVSRDGWDGGGEVSQDGILHAGINSITIKLHEGGGGDYMGVRVTDRSGNALADLTYRFTPQPVVLVNPVTASPLYLCSSNFSIQAFSGIEDGDEYQFSNSTNEVDLGSWLTYSAANPPTSGSLAPPAEDGPWDIHVWTRRDQGAPAYVTYSATYSTEAPVARASDRLVNFDTVNGTVITPAMIDAGSTYGVSGFYQATVTPPLVYAAGNVTYTVVNNAGLSNSVVVAISGDSWPEAYVSPGGSDSTGTGHIDAPWRTISHAMATLGKASDCTLYIAPGVYDAAAGETFPIEPGIVKFQGQGSAPTDVIIEAGGSDAQAVLLNGTVSRAFLHNLAVKGGVAGLFIDTCTCSDFDIENCVFTGASTHGVKIESTPNAEFVDCVVTNNAVNGLWFNKSADLSLLRCAFAFNGGNGIFAEGEGWGVNSHSTGLRASYCYFGSNGSRGVGYDGFGVTGWILDHCTLLGNASYGSGAGYPSYYVSMLATNCIVAENGSYGFFMNAGTIAAADTLFNNNVGGAFGGSDEYKTADKGGCVYDVDPVFLPWASRIDGAVYEGSPVLGAAADGSNLGCYQGIGFVPPDGVDYHVSTDGNDGADGLTAATAFATFAPFAARTMNPGDKIHVAAGVYTNGATFAGSGSGIKPIEIDFAPGAVFTVADTPAFTLSGSQNVKVSGLIIAGGKGAVVNNSAASCLFTNCVFGGCSGNGVTLQGVSGLEFADCVVTNNSGYGIYGDKAAAVTLIRSVIADNGSDGVLIGNQYASNDGPANSGLKADYCFFGRNNGNGLALGTQAISGWTANHCTFVANAGIGYGNAGWSPYPQGCVATNCVFAFNIAGGIYMSDSPIYSDCGLFWRDGRAPLTSRSENSTHHLAADRSANVYDADPLLCAWNSRNDGAVYAGSPVLGAAADGSNLGCYQGAGIALPAATTYYVAPGGSDASDGSQAEPFATLAKACASVANPGDTIRVAAGVYEGASATLSVAANSAAPVRVIGEAGATVKTTGGSALVLADCTDVAVSGLAFEASGHGIDLRNAIGCSFADCTATNCDSGVYADVASLHLSFERCLFVGNRTAGALMIGGANTRFSRCRFDGNSRFGMDNEGGNNGNYSPECTNVVVYQCIANNNGTAGFWSGASGDIRAENCLAVGNGSGTSDVNRGGFVFWRSWRLIAGNTARNSIAYDNDGYGIARGNDEYANCFVVNCCAYGNTVAAYGNIADGCITNAITADPLFVNAAQGNYRLTSASPCVDAGTNQTWMVGATDMGGVNARIGKKFVDMGPYELFTQGLVIVVR